MRQSLNIDAAIEIIVSIGATTETFAAGNRERLIKCVADWIIDYAKNNKLTFTQYDMGCDDIEFAQGDIDIRMSLSTRLIHFAIKKEASLADFDLDGHRKLIDGIVVEYRGKPLSEIPIRKYPPMDATLAMRDKKKQAINCLHVMKNAIEDPFTGPIGNVIAFQKAVPEFHYENLVQSRIFVSRRNWRGRATAYTAYTFDGAPDYATFATWEEAKEWVYGALENVDLDFVREYGSDQVRAWKSEQAELNNVV